MSQQELADLCELSVDQVANIECGKSFAGEVTITMLARIWRPASIERNQSPAPPVHL